MGVQDHPIGVSRRSDLPGRQAEIRVLPDALVDQIAAGEVVERPASVVKELVENALDAGARRIRVEAREGGAAFMAVTDDGRGMRPEAARLALRRHATSKLASLEDLSRIRSFGFRGEALPAIASVSRFRLLTREADADAAHEVRIESGEIRLERTAGGPIGTRVEVADLFAKVPARRKFLKKAGTEWGHIADWLSRLALSLPGIHFEVLRDDREAVVWPATASMQTRIAAVLGRKEAEGLIRVEWEEGAGHLEAWVSGPERSRTNGNGLYLYVNGRPVRDKVLRHALVDAYRDVLPRGRFPTGILFVTIAPERVDVNVHPAKWEVRFAEPQSVHQLVRHAVREAMLGRAWLGHAEDRHAGSGASGAPSATSNAAGWRRVEAGRGDAIATDWSFARGAAEQALQVRDAEHSADPQLIPGPDPGAPDERIAFSTLRLIGQLQASYLLVEGPAGLLLVDQHAAHERILYERLRASWLDHGVERQGLLVPATVELDALSRAALDASADAVEGLGFELEAFGEAAVLVRAVPALLAGRDPEALVRGLAEQLAEGEVEPGERPDRTRLLVAADRVFATLACHSARRFGDHLEADEQRAILRGLDAIPWAPTCPHGRPVAAQFDRAEIEKRFRRR
jgi:DNA mismatch repair protein MutL